MLKKIGILFLTIFIISISFNYAKYTNDSLSFLNDPNISNNEKKERIIVIIKKLKTELNRLKKEREKKEEQNKDILLKLNNELINNIKAKSFGVYWIKNNELKDLFLKNDKKSYSLASLTKLMTAVVAWENLDIDKKIKITNKALDEYGDNGLVIGEKFTLYDLMVFMVTVSSNDAAVAISRSQLSRDDFIFYMNKKAKKLKMNNTLFKSETGLDVADKATAWGSAKDISMLLTYVYKNYPYLSDRSTNYRNIVESDKIIHKIYNVNKLLREYKNFKLSKTGYELSSGGNLATIYQIDENHIIAIVVLGSTINGRFSDTEEIIKKTREYFKIVEK